MHISMKSIQHINVSRMTLWPYPLCQTVYLYWWDSPRNKTLSVLFVCVVSLSACCVDSCTCLFMQPDWWWNEKLTTSPLHCIQSVCVCCCCSREQEVFHFSHKQFNVLWTLCDVSECMCESPCVGVCAYSMCCLPGKIQHGICACFNSIFNLS